jgi:2-isopropylmalate synthase
VTETQTITLLDSTLRDGAQGEQISFSVQDKVHIVQALDELGIQFIEAGNPGSNPKDLEFFREIQKIPLANTKVCAFGSTRRKGIAPEDDGNLQSLLAANTGTVVFFGKTSVFQVERILRAELEENLAMIRETAAFLKGQGRGVIFDAEHFFDAFKENPDYALRCLEAAQEGGAETLVLCDTRGGCLPGEIGRITRLAAERFDSCAEIGVHTHNDCGLGVANSLAAVEAGARHVQGTLLGFGERTGNANLSTIIANLELKMNASCLPAGHLERLTSIVRQVAEIANITLDSGMPYVGHNAFAHKAGMHIDAVLKDPESYEHIVPETVGNDRVILVSEAAGRAAVLEKIRKFDPLITKDSPVASEILKTIKDLEHSGYQFEGAEGSFELLVRKALKRYRPFFKLHYYKTIGEKPRLDDYLCSFAQLKIEVNGQLEVTAGEGDGPVHALDVALRRALERFYPAVSHIRLTDYKVRVLDSQSATAAKVRVLIESSDGAESWSTVGVSSDIMEASWLALVDSIEYYLIYDFERQLGASGQ